jgi:hypothetical protein
VVRIECVGSLPKRGCLRSPVGSSFPWKSIWRNRVPLRVTFFVWTDALGNILTLDSLRKRHHSDELVLYVQEEWGIH